jgi:hypothetical protein
LDSTVNAIEAGDRRVGMSKNRKSPPLDRANLNLADRAATRHWSKTWGVSASEMQRAIDKVCPTVHAVAKELGVAHDLDRGTDASRKIPAGESELSGCAGVE